MKKVNLHNNFTSLIQTALWLSVCLSSTVNAELTSPDWSATNWPVKILAPAENMRYLNPLEKNIILHLNTARTDPGLYSQEFISPRSFFYKDKVYLESAGPKNVIELKTQEGVSAVDQATQIMNSTKALEPLKENSFSVIRYAHFL